MKVLWVERYEGGLGRGVPGQWDLVPPGALGGSDLGQKPVPLSSLII